MNQLELERLKQSIDRHRKTMSFILEREGTEKKKVSDKKRQLENLTKGQKKYITNLQISADKHFEKLVNIQPKEEKTVEDFKTPGKLYDPEIRSIQTKKTYRQRMRTFVKWCVINDKTVNKLEKITLDHYKKFIEEKVNEGLSSKSVDSYIDGIYKFFSATSMNKHGYPKGFDSHREMIESLPEVKQELRDLVPDYSLENRIRGKKDGYSIGEANAIIKAAEKHMSILEKSMIETLGYMGPRAEEILQVKPEHIDLEKGVIAMIEKGMTKQGRPRKIVDMPERTKVVLQDLLETGHFPPGQPIWGSYFNQETARDVVKEACGYAKVGYSALHDFRKAFLERTERDLYKDLKAGRLTKEELIEKILDQVGVDPRLNPYSPQKEIVRENGKIVYRKTKSGSLKPIFRYQRDEKGNKVFGFKFTKEKLEQRSLYHLTDLYVAEQLGHSDTESNSPYRGEKARERREVFKIWCKENKK